MSENSATPLTMIGLGPMGQAMVRRYLAAGHPTTVWNRTAARADDLVAEGAVRAATVADAVAANRLVLVSLTDYAAMYDVLKPAEGELTGRVIVNLSSDTPERTREAAAWLAERGAELLVGGVMVPEEMVGTDAAYVFYSGRRSTFDAHEPTLRVIGRADHRGEDSGLAQLYYQAQLSLFLTSLAAYLHATALVGSAGVSAAEFLPYAVDNVEGLAYFLGDAAREIDAGRYPGDGANVTMMGATADHIVGSSLRAGIDAGLPAAVKSLYDRGVAAGHGRDSWTSLIEVVRKG
ncbi:MAG TPA: NAD(P)-binding domain-containing protein [Pseudonocardia sp.]|jgi:3-hydroxyisobutyrate dehydrogenase-like beta-hydroxyacid dehydrogenase